MTEQNSERLALRPQEAARALGVSLRTLWTMTSPRGPIPCVRLPSGKRAAVLYPVEALRQWMAAEMTRQCHSASQDDESCTGVEMQKRETQR